MYDVPLSVPWFFDKCLELQPFIPFVLTATVICLGIFSTVLLLFTKRLNVSLTLKRFIASIPILLANIVFVVIFLKSLFSDGPVGIGVFVVLLVLALCDTIWYFLLKFNFPTKKATKDTARTTLVNFLLTTITLAPATALFTFIFGFIICIETSFITPLDAAHPIHAIIKERFNEGTTVPRTLDDLKSINPEKYTLLSSRAKLAYIYDEEKNSYTFFVRPSAHYVAVFDNTKDIVIYKLDQGRYYYDSDQTKLFPPTYPGPWEQLPK